MTHSLSHVCCTSIVQTDLSQLLWECADGTCAALAFEMAHTLSSAIRAQRAKHGCIVGSESKICMKLERRQRLSTCSADMPLTAQQNGVACDMLLSRFI